MMSVVYGSKKLVSDKANINEAVEEENDSPIEEVRLTVPITDDPTLPCLTFRTRFLGIISCAALGFVNQFFNYRQNFTCTGDSRDGGRSAGLEAGVAFMAILCYFTLQFGGIAGPSWWGQAVDDHCPLAKCPTAPGIQVEGCPVVHR